MDHSVGNRDFNQVLGGERIGPARFGAGYRLERGDWRCASWQRLDIGHAEDEFWQEGGGVGGGSLRKECLRRGAEAEPCTRGGYLGVDHEWCEV